jgi:hypothetical protein
VPVAHLLNKVIDTAESYISQSHLSGLRFHPYGRELKEIYGSHEPLKPDVVGIIGELPAEPEEPAEEPAEERAKRPKLSWEQVEAAFESKGTVRDMVRQSGTYARCCVLSNRRRFFSLGIGFHYKKMEAYFFVFHRGELSSSRPLKVTTSEGFQGLVKYIVGILSLNEEATHDLDTTRFESHQGPEDAVFGGLIKEWSGIFGRATEETQKLMKHLSMIPLDNQQGSEQSMQLAPIVSYEGLRRRAPVWVRPPSR